MATTKLYHGTIYGSLSDCKEGKVSPWTVSDNDGLTYFWELEGFAERECFDFDDVDERRLIEERCIFAAFEQAEIQAAVTGEDQTLTVLVYEVEKENYEEDYSCDNMEGAVCMPADEAGALVPVEVYEVEFNKWTAPLIIKGLSSNTIFNRALPEGLLAVANRLSTSDFYHEPEFDYRRV